MVRGQQLFSKAKAANDELIERLLVAVREGDDPSRSPSLRSAMEEAVARRLSFSSHVEAHLPKLEGTRSTAAAGWLDKLDPAKLAAETVKALAEAVSILWKTWREGRELDRQALTTRLTAQRWRAFAGLPEAQ
jgi:hypothetical protein